MGWVLGLIVAINGYKSFAAVLAPFIKTPSLQQAVAFLVLCLSMVLLSYALALALHSILKALALNPVDKLMGAGFGAARGLLIVLLVINLLAPFLKNDAWWQEATFPNALLPYVPVAQQFTDEIKKQVHHLPKATIVIPKSSQH
jgi:membrane protein required for colicin V production